MINDQSNSNSQYPKQKYDLEDRTTKFAKEIINFSVKIPKNPITSPLINQLVRSGTSIGANYCEADEASSKKDFANKICISKKEAKETRYWLKIVSHTVPELSSESDRLWREAQELNLIFATIIRNCKS